MSSSLPVPSRRHSRVSVIVSLYAGYAVFMVLRMATPAVGATMTSPDSGLGITTSDWGKILSMGTVGAVVGKFLGGWVTDRFGGRTAFVGGLAVCTLGIAAFSFSSTVAAFQATLFVALMAKSFGWPGMTRIVGQTFRPAEYGRVWGVLSTSSRAGTLVATFGLGSLLAVMSWQAVLIIATALGLVATIAFAGVQGYQDEPEPNCQKADTPLSSIVAADHPLHGATLGDALIYMSRSLQFWLIVVSLSALTIMWDFLLVVPLMLKSMIPVTNSQATMASSAFPLGSLISVFAGGFIFDALSRRSMAWVMGGLLTVATLAVGGFLSLAELEQLSVGPSVYVGVSVTLLFIFGLCVAPCYYIPMSVFSIEFGGPHVGFLVALLDAIAFGVNAVFQWTSGTVAEESWDDFLKILLVISIVAAVSTWMFMLGEARRIESSPAS